MRTQIWILAGSFIVFALIAWLVMEQFSLAYLGLIVFGVACFFLGYVGTK